MALKQSSRDIKRSYWQNHIEKWSTSGLTQKKYCDKEHIKFTTFTWWRCKSLKNKAQTNSLSFMPAIITEVKQQQIQARDGIEVVLPNQIKVIYSNHIKIRS